MDTQVELLKLAKNKKERKIRKNTHLILSIGFLFASFRKFKRYNRFFMLSHKLSFKYWLIFSISNISFFILTDYLINTKHWKDKYVKVSKLYKFFKQV